MNTFQIRNYAYPCNDSCQQEFEDALCFSNRCYSIQHLISSGVIAPDEMLEALQKAMKVCSLAGVDSSHHFKKIYIYDETENKTYIDWMMTKKGLSLILIQYPLLNEKLARWIVDLTEQESH
ncbi:MAG: hypothetical protein NTW54_04455 [Bacteroidetes bacterium]|nr:hypothetical protein [Bacteroidota bacterium]